MKLTPINAPSLNTNDQLNETIEVTVAPGTDLWRKPPSTDVYNAPCWVAYFPAVKFKRARVTVSANWTRLYDQGGLVLFLPGWPSRTLWVKSGIEFVDGKPYVSTVAARDAADWSLLPSPGGQTKITLEIEREEVNKDKGTGTSLFVYLVEGERRTAVREITWAFKEEEDLTGQISVGIYAARPTKTGENDTEKLVVKFEDLAIV
ncbi:hypothetical protein K439DRAFT_1340344 [Ramaria rubella]|nr:hypothetical protein K439DRAFT_1340344 [Ramaria rubella]